MTGKEFHPRQGKGWARTGLILGIAASITGNVTHTVLTPSEVALQLRVPLAVVWPVFTMVGIETLVRVAWPQRRFTVSLAQGLLVGPVSCVAAIVSYLHLHHLLLLGGETHAVSVLGPLAIDGLMIGCGMALLVTRAPVRARAPGLARTELATVPATELATVPAATPHPHAVTELPPTLPPPGGKSPNGKSNVTATRVRNFVRSP